MNSQKFIELNRDTWTRFRGILDQIDKKGAASLSRQDMKDVGPLFRRITAHLAYAQANYPDTDMVSYLNHLVARAHSSLYRTETASVRSLLNFYCRGFPWLIYRYRKYVFTASLFLVLSVAWGAWLNHSGSSLAVLVLPDEIREAVNQNFAEGKTGSGIEDSLKPLFSSAILVNNITVSFYCLVLGITWGLGTVFILVRNGLLLGALADIFAGAQQGLEFWSLILPHGIPELFAVALNGAAGLMIAGALVRPGDFTRRDALKLKAIPAMKISMGSIPILVAAAAIEGFVTPLHIPPQAKLVFAVFTGVLLGYYVYSGSSKQRKGEDDIAGPVSL